MRPLGPLYAVLVIASLIVRVRFVFAVTAALGVVALVAWLQVRAGARSVRASRHVERRAFVGDAVRVRLQVENSSRWPQSIVEITEALPQALAPDLGERTRFVMAVPGRSVRTVDYRLRCRARGYHRVGPLHGQVGDVFGLETRRLPDAVEDRLIVYPRIVPMPRLGLPANGPVPAVAHRDSVTEDPYRPIGARDYQVGDSARTIAWAASARAGRLLVRQFQPAHSRDTVICLDLDRRSFVYGRSTTAIELAVTTAASIGHHILTRERLAAGLLVHGADPLAATGRPPPVPVARGTAHLTAHLEVLARVGATSEGNFAATLERGALHFPFGATVVLVVAGIPEPVGAVALDLRRRGFAVAAVLVGSEPGPVAAPEGVAVYRVRHRHDVAALV